jgi:hypothetical protein
MVVAVYLRVTLVMKVLVAVDTTVLKRSSYVSMSINSMLLLLLLLLLLLVLSNATVLMIVQHVLYLQQ